MFVIAGATGRVGSVVAGELLERGMSVRVVVRDADKAATLQDRGAELAVGVLDDRTFLTDALRGASGFFTLLPGPSFDEPDFAAAQRRMSEAVAGAVEASGVPHVVLLSSVGAEMAKGHGPIGGLHTLETLLRATGAKLTALRAGYFQENVASALGPARQAGIFPSFTTSEDVAWPMVASRDIARVAIESLLSPPAKSEVIDVHGPTYSSRQIGEMLGQALGKKLQVVALPESTWVDTLVQAGLPRHFGQAFAEMYAALGKGILGPKGDRLVRGPTTMEETVRDLVR